MILIPPLRPNLYICTMLIDRSSRLQADEPEHRDLAERLARYRSRVAREGRKSAVERLDRAIEKTRREPKKTKEPGENKET